MDELLNDTLGSGTSRGGSTTFQDSRRNTYSNQDADVLKERFEKIEGSHPLNEFIIMYECLETQVRQCLDQLICDKNESYRLAGIPADKVATLSQIFEGAVLTALVLDGAERPKMSNLIKTCSESPFVLVNETKI